MCRHGRSPSASCSTSAAWDASVRRAGARCTRKRASASHAQPSTCLASAASCCAVTTGKCPGRKTAASSQASAAAVARRVGRARVGPQQARRAQVAQARGAVGREQHARGRHAQVRDAVAVQEVQRARERQRHPAAPAQRAGPGGAQDLRRAGRDPRTRAREMFSAHASVTAGAACRMREHTCGAGGGHAGGTPMAHGCRSVHGFQPVSLCH